MLKRKMSKPTQQPAAPQRPDPATAPVIDILIRFDARNGALGVTVIGTVGSDEKAARASAAARATGAA